jgi:bifunctional non-homologous end joining protein LigD
LPSAERPPRGRKWRYEPKDRRLPRYRPQIWLQCSRNQKDFTRRFPDVVKAIAQLPSDTLIDGEIVALDEPGKPPFNLSR